MKLRNSNLDDFLKEIDRQKIYCFGASIMPQEICEEYEEIHFEKRVTAFVDNDSKKVGSKYQLLDRYIPIISVEDLQREITHGDIVLITSKYYVEIYEQLNSIKELNNISCYIWPAIAPQYKSDTELKMKIKQLSRNDEIPKKIHYFWFGKGKMPELHQRCVDSWSRVCPEYEIIRWDESNYDITKNKYMEQAYKAGKWGFVPDYARLDVIYEHGGIYLDTDVEVVRPFDDLLKVSGFAGFESKNLVALGLGFGARRHSKVLKNLREDYEGRVFLREDGSLDLTPSPFLQTEVLKKHGLELNNKFQIVEDFVILPTECLSPDNNMIPHITPNTYSIHHFAGSWTSANQQAILEKMRAFLKNI